MKGEYYHIPLLCNHLSTYFCALYCNLSFSLLFLLRHVNLQILINLLGVAGQISRSLNPLSPDPGLYSPWAVVPVSPMMSHSRSAQCSVSPTAKYELWSALREICPQAQLHFLFFLTVVLILTIN